MSVNPADMSSARFIPFSFRNGDRSCLLDARNRRAEHHDFGGWHAFDTTKQDAAAPLGASGSFTFTISSAR